MPSTVHTATDRCVSLVTPTLAMKTSRPASYAGMRFRGSASALDVRHCTGERYAVLGRSTVSEHADAVSRGIPTECWLHPDVEVSSSPIHGRGLFAAAALASGTVISRLGGTIVCTAWLLQLLDSVADDEHGYLDTVMIGADQHLILPSGTPNGLGNHSCDPNTWWIDSHKLTARRPIAAGEEITNDYATSTAAESFSMPCMCASPLCRRVITGGDWRIPDLRERYGRHWVPAVQALIDAAFGGPH